MFAEHQGQALKADGKTDSRKFRAAEVTNQTVVTTTGGDRILRAKAAGHHLKGRFGVIVESSYHAGINRVVDVECLDMPLDLVKVGLTTDTEIVQHGWCINGDLLAARDLAVEDTQRVAGVAAPAIGAETGQLPFEKINQCFAISRSTFRAAEGVDL